MLRIIGFLFLLSSFLTATADDIQLPTATIYKSPTCGCCGDWVKHLQQHGFKTDTVDSNEMNQIKHQLGVPPELASCHTAKIGDYIIEGHVPAADIIKLLNQPQNVLGLSVPGMPIGSPGMEIPGRASDTYQVVTFDKQGNTTLFNTHGPQSQHQHQ